MDRGPLHGLPIRLKDNIDTAGSRTTAGSRILIDRIKSRDATIVRRLRRAGVVFLGKHALREFAIGSADNPTFGRTRNPWTAARPQPGPAPDSLAWTVGVAAFLLSALGRGSFGSNVGRRSASPSRAIGLRVGRLEGEPFSEVDP